MVKLAAMSNILLYDHEVELLAADLESVLTYASSLQAIAQRHTMDITATVKNTNIMRDDLIQATPSQPLLALAPEREGDYFVVPKIIKN